MVGLFSAEGIRALLLEKHCLGTVGYMGGIPAMMNKFVHSIVDMIQYNAMFLCGQDEYIHYTSASTTYHEMARNELVKNMRGAWLLQLDTDHAFAPDLLERLLFRMCKYGSDVISGIYQYKHPPHMPIATIWAQEGEIGPCQQLQSWNPKADILEVGTVPGGCLLVKRDVFDRILKETGNNPFDMVPGLSEDYSFCKRLKDLGIPVHLTTKVECHHIIQSLLSIVDYPNPYKEPDPVS